MPTPTPEQRMEEVAQWAAERVASGATFGNLVGELCAAGWRRTRALEMVHMVNAVLQRADNNNEEGMQLIRLGEYQSAIDAFTAAIELDPKYASAYRNRAEARQIIGRSTATTSIWWDGWIDAQIDLDMAEMLVRDMEVRASEERASRKGKPGAIVGVLLWNSCGYIWLFCLFMWLVLGFFGLIVGAVLGGIYGQRVGGKVGSHSRDVIGGIGSGGVGGISGVIIGGVVGALGGGVAAGVVSGILYAFLVLAK